MLGDCLDVLKTLPANSIDAIVTDPPYGLSFMGEKWDYDVPSTEVWAECLRVLKPGGHLLALAGTRTQHRMAVRIEDAGFEIRDMIAWVYSTGFPKSRNLDGEWAGWGTALKPALEPITVARKPLSEGTVAANVLQHGTGAINVDGCRVGYDLEIDDTRRKPVPTSGWCLSGSPTSGSMDDSALQGRWPANLIHDGSEEVVRLFPQANGNSNKQLLSREGGMENAFSGFPGGRSDTGMGRADSGSAARFFYCAKASKADRDEGCEGLPVKRCSDGRSSGLSSGMPEKALAPARNHHPTVKPTDLMRYLCRLVTPPGGVVLDPFTGSGSTGKAAILEGFRFIGIERDAEYLELAKARINNAKSQLQP
jgi:site-specific DNA-methyltransferase (adenine-specific)